jgi:urease accessory protein
MPTVTTSSLARLFVIGVASLLASPASAHHAMGGKTPSTFFEGFLSGLAHPILGLDHFAFIIALGILTVVCRLNLSVALATIGASALGVAAHVAGLTIGISEAIVIASVVLCGAALALRVSIPRVSWSLILPAAGFFHGYAYGESIFGAQQTPLAAYLLGLVVIQSAIVFAVITLFRLPPVGVNSMGPRVAGAVVAVVGLGMLAGAIFA